MPGTFFYYGANFKMIGFPFVKILFFAYQTHFATSEVAFFAKNPTDIP